MALVTIRRSSTVQTPGKTDEAERSSENEEDIGSNVCKSLNECYFANKGAALVLGGGGGGAARGRRRRSPARAPHIQHHLQAMFYLLRPEETLKMAVKLESAHAGRTRYLVVVCRGDEAALLGIDCNDATTVGLVLRVLADTSIKLDGDGGFSVCVCNQQHIFKPVSVQAMWSALQTLHRASGRARELNHFAGGASHAWAAHYEARVDSDRSCLNEWHAMDCLESRRPPSPDSLRLKPRERSETERVIRSTLKDILMSVDLDEVTSKAIRGRLEDELEADLQEYKPFIDHEMLTILGQMDAPTEIFEHVYLGSEWNASNLDELQRNGVRHILNVTREIDNFFPGMFEYLNVRVYDDDTTDLLKHWDDTYKYIERARRAGRKVLVHCKMGISRSASVVIAYAMKAYSWPFERALRHVKAKRGCIKPNTNFLGQLETYQGILDAMKNKEKLQRSKSETNLESPAAGARAGAARGMAPAAAAAAPPPRPRSWSPDAQLAAALLPPTSLSLEHLPPAPRAAPALSRHMLMPSAHGSYSVSPNQIMRLKEQRAPSVRRIVHRIERGADWAPPERAPDPPDLSSATTSDAITKLGDRIDSDDRRRAEGGGGAAPPSRHSSCSSFGSCASERGLTDNERKFNETCAILKELGGMRGRAPGSWGGRLSASAPAGTWLRGGGGRRRRLAAASQPDLSAPPAAPAPAPAAAGLVSNLKKEFEARGAGAREEEPRAAPPALDDLSVRVLVGRYDGAPRAVAPPEARAPPRAPPFLRNSFCGARPSAERPPIAPHVVAMTFPPAMTPVMSKAQNKKQLQHGKTHPLTRLNMNRSSNRCSNPVYNTM